MKTSPGTLGRAAVCRAVTARAVRALLPPLGSSASLRWTFYLGGLVCLSSVRIFDHVVLNGPRYDPTVHGLGISAFLLAALVFFYLSSRSTIPPVLHGLLPHSRALLAVGLLGALVFVPRSLVLMARIPGQLAQARHYQLDSVAMVDCGTRLWLRGHNPYTDFDLVACLTHTGVPHDATTPLQVGPFARVHVYPTHEQLVQVFAQVSRQHVQNPAAFESHFSYPAGTIILTAPVLALGWHEISLFYLLCLVVMYVLLAWWAPRRVRPWLALLAVANITVWEYAVGIAADSLVVLLLLSAWATWRRAWLSAVLIGAAIATRQNAWFFLPFYAMLIGRTYGWRMLIQRLAVVAAVFGLVNGPFFLQSPVAWTDGVLGQLVDPMFSMGNGFIVAADVGWLPLWSRHTYAALEVAALIACVLVYARTCRRHPGTACVWALVPLLFAWRSPLLYFVPLTLLCLWPLLTDLHTREAGKG